MAERKRRSSWLGSRSPRTWGVAACGSRSVRERSGCRPHRRGAALERVQVKRVASDGLTIVVRCYSPSLTTGDMMAVHRYTRETIDWLAVYDTTTDRCFHPGGRTGSGGARSISTWSHRATTDRRTSASPMTMRNYLQPKLTAEPRGGVVVMGARGLCKARVGVRFPSPPCGNAACESRKGGPQRVPVVEKRRMNGPSPSAAPRPLRYSPGEPASLPLPQVKTGSSARGLWRLDRDSRGGVAQDRGQRPRASEGRQSERPARSVSPGVAG